MTTDRTTRGDETTLFLGETWFDPIEAGLREQIRGFIEGLIEEELTAARGRRRYERGSGETRSALAASPRHGSVMRTGWKANGRAGCCPAMPA